jgi:hypothetical protein
MTMITLVFEVTSDNTFHPKEPNKTKLSLQVLAAIKGKSEKIRFGGQNM